MNKGEISPHRSYEDTFFRETITYSTFVGMLFQGTDFRRVEARLTSFERCRFVDCSFGNGNFTFGRFIDCTFEFSDDSTMEKGSFSGSVFERCEFSTLGRLRIKECNFRGAHLQQCKFGEMDFTSNGLEDAFFEDCAFDLLDIRSVSATALMFKDCSFTKILISVENLSSIIGLAELDKAATGISVEFLSKRIGIDSVATTTESLIEFVEIYRKKKELDPFQFMNTEVILAKLRKQDIPVAKLNSSLEELETKVPVFAFDQIANIVKMLDYHNLLSVVDLSPIRRIFDQFNSIRSQLPFALVQRVLAANQLIKILAEPEFEIVFYFQNADASLHSDRVACYEFIEKYRQIFQIQAASSSSIQIGSFKLSEFVKLGGLSPWLISLVFLINNTSISVELDANKLSEDIISAAKELKDSVSVTQLEKLENEAAVLKLQLEIQKTRVELNRSIKIEELTEQLLATGN